MTPVPRLLLTVALVLLAFGSFAGSCQGKPSGRCLSNADCHSTERCVALSGGSQRCYTTCDAATTILCQSGDLCAEVAAEDASVDVCLPGGATALGAACVTSSDCVRGAICFQPQGGNTFACRASCEVGGAAVCAATETCVSVGAIDSPSRGVCIVSGS